MDLPEPLVSAEIDVRDLDGFMLNVERLLASELWALSTPEEFKAAMALWCRAWKQLPGGSLPNDERVLAAFAGVGARWRKVRDMALRGFILCSDGRLYHKVLCEDVLRAFTKKAERRERTKAATEARQRLRDEQRHVPPDVPHNGSAEPQRNVVPGTGQGQDRDEKEERAPNGALSESGSRRPSDVAAMMTKIWKEECGEISQPHRANPTRIANCAKRWKDDFGKDAEAWRAYCQRIAAAPHLRGENDRGWKADFDWVLKPDNLAHIMEGRYDPRLANGRGNGAGGYGGPDAPAPSVEELFGDDDGREMGMAH